MHLKLKEMDNDILVEQEFGPGLSRIVVFGQAGDDEVKVHKNLGAVPAELYGGPGDDKLSGGEGHDVIVGGDGDDLLMGTDGRDLLIGGLGADKIIGDDNDDILIGGVYFDQINRPAAQCHHVRVDANRPALR